MIRDEDVMKGGIDNYMKPHEKVLYVLALLLGIAGVIAGIVLLAVGLGNDNSDLWITGIVMLVVGLAEMAGVGLLLWTEGTKRTRHTDGNSIEYSSKEVR